MINNLSIICFIYPLKIKNVEDLYHLPMLKFVNKKNTNQNLLDENEIRQKNFFGSWFFLVLKPETFLKISCRNCPDQPFILLVKFPGSDLEKLDSLTI